MGLDFSDNVLLSDWSRAMPFTESRCLRRILSSDHFLILTALCSPADQPMASISVQFLSQKTAFLLAPAPGRHCSEFHALSGNPAGLSFERDGSVTIQHVPKCFVQNQPLGSRALSTSPKTLSSILTHDFVFFE